MKRNLMLAVSSLMVGIILTAYIAQIIFFPEFSVITAFSSNKIGIVSPAENYILLYQGETIELYEFGTWRLKNTFSSYIHTAYNVFFSPNGEYFVIYNEHEYYLLRTSDGQQLSCTLDAFNRSIFKLGFSDDSEVFFVQFNYESTTSPTTLISLYDTSTGNEIVSRMYYLLYEFEHLVAAFTPDSREFLVAYPYYTSEGRFLNIESLKTTGYYNYSVIFSEKTSDPIVWQSLVLGNQCFGAVSAHTLYAFQKTGTLSWSLNWTYELHWLSHQYNASIYTKIVLSPDEQCFGVLSSDADNESHNYLWFFYPQNGTIFYNTNSTLSSPIKHIFFIQNKFIAWGSTQQFSVLNRSSQTILFLITDYQKINYERMQVSSNNRYLALIGDYLPGKSYIYLLDLVHGTSQKLLCDCYSGVAFTPDSQYFFYQQYSESFLKQEQIIYKLNLSSNSQKWFFSFTNMESWNYFVSKAGKYLVSYRYLWLGDITDLQPGVRIFPL